MILAVCSFIIALAIFAYTYFLFHYLGDDGNFVSVFHESPEKPFVTFLFGIWGVMFLFSSLMCFLIGIIFGTKKSS